jgi:hypothetical protein
VTDPRIVSRRLAVVAVTLASLTMSVVRAQPRVERTFDGDRAGAQPDGFLFARMKGAPVGRWTVQRAGADSFLAQLGEGVSDSGILLALIDGQGHEYENVRVGTRVRLAGGERAAGVVWRYQDAENFYMASLDLAAQRIDVYRIAQGNRVRIKSEDDLSLDPNAWHTLTVVHEENEIRLYIGGIHVFEFWDRALRRAGRAGVWSTAGTVAHFDVVTVQPEVDDHEAPRRRRRD